MQRSVPNSILVLLLAAGSFPLASLGQKHQPAPQRPTEPQRGARPNAPGAHPAGPGERPNARPSRGNNPNVAMPDAIARWNAMKPEVRERALAKLPPEQQKRLRERLATFNQLPPAEQQKMTERYERFSRMPQEQQQAIRSAAQMLHRLPPDRKQAVNKELVKMGKMSDEQRDRYFAGEEFQKKFSPAEQEMLQNLSKITPHQE